MAQKKPEVSDPLEAAKIGMPDAPAAPQEPRAAKASQPPVALAEPTLPPPGKPEPHETFRVVGRVTISWGGQFVRLSPGDLVSERLYGKDAVERMREAGVALERVE